MTDMCPLCEHGELQSRTINETIRYGGANLVVPGIEISACPNCDEEVVLPEQTKANERRFSDAKRAHDGLLTSGQIVAWRKRHSLTQQQAASLIGGGINAFSKYERGEVMQSQSVDSLMRAVDEVPAMLAFLCARAGVTLPTGSVRLDHAASNIIVLNTRHVTRTLVTPNEIVGQWSFDSELELAANG